MFYSGDKNDWKLTKIILEHGCEVTFETAWAEDNCLPGFDGKKGNALDFAKDFKNCQTSANDFDVLILMLNKQKVKNIITLIQKVPQKNISPLYFFSYLTC